MTERTQRKRRNAGQHIKFGELISQAESIGVGPQYLLLHFCEPPASVVNWTALDMGIGVILKSHPGVKLAPFYRVGSIVAFQPDKSWPAGDFCVCLIEGVALKFGSVTTQDYIKL